MIDKQTITEAVVRGWCAPECSDIEMDSRLTLAIVREIESALATTSTEPAKEPASDADIEALRPFAELAELFDPENLGSSMPGKDGDPIMLWPRMHKEYELTVGHLRKAREVLASRCGAPKGGVTCDNGASPAADVVVPTSGIVCESLGSLLLTQAERAALAASAAPSAKQEPSEITDEQIDNALEGAREYIVEGFGYKYNESDLRAAIRSLAAPSASASPAAPVAGSQQVPEEVNGVNLARLLRNLEETSYNEGSIDLACRCSDSLTVIKGLLAAASPAVPVPAEQGWISVEDALPKFPRSVLVARHSDADGEPCLDPGVAMLYPDGKWRGIGVFYAMSKQPPYEMRETAMEVTHWMPLPAAPSLQQPKEGAAS